MDIKTFITETLVQIIEGAKAAAIQVPDAGICFDARAVRSTDNGKMLPFVPLSKSSPKGRPDCGFFDYVSFDLAVTTTESSTAGGRGSLQVAGVVSLGGKKETGSEQSTTSRVSFRIPMALPVLRKEMQENMCNE